MKPLLRREIALIATLAAGALFSVPSTAKDEPIVTVFAAASLTNALQDIGTRYQSQNAARIRFSFAASSLLAKQIESGGGVDIFVSADPEWMDYLAMRKLIASGTRRNLVGNRLVLIAPRDGHMSLEIRKNFPLAGALKGGRLALADPDTVPAGRYARDALINLGVWDSIAGHLAPAENVRTALAYVARGETPLGIVYETDARIEPRVRVIGIIPETTHPPIEYPVALVREARPQAKAFFDYLFGHDARAIFERYGFIVLGGAN